jgi:hypothetical protein
MKTLHDLVADKIERDLSLLRIALAGCPPEAVRVELPDGPSGRV